MGSRGCYTLSWSVYNALTTCRGYQSIRFLEQTPTAWPSVPEYIKKLDDEDVDAPKVWNWLLDQFVERHCIRGRCRQRIWPRWLPPEIVCGWVLLLTNSTKRKRSISETSNTALPSNHDCWFNNLQCSSGSSEHSIVQATYAIGTACPNYWFGTKTWIHRALDSAGRYKVKPRDICAVPWRWIQNCRFHSTTCDVISS